MYSFFLFFNIVILIASSFLVFRYEGEFVRNSLGLKVKEGFGTLYDLDQHEPWSFTGGFERGKRCGLGRFENAKSKTTMKQPSPSPSSSCFCFWFSSALLFFDSSHLLSSVLLLLLFSYSFFFFEDIIFGEFDEHRLYGLRWLGRVVLFFRGAGNLYEGKLFHNACTDKQAIYQ